MNRANRSERRARAAAERASVRPRHDRNVQAVQKKYLDELDKVSPESRAFVEKFGIAALSEAIKLLKPAPIYGMRATCKDCGNFDVPYAHVVDLYTDEVLIPPEGCAICVHCPYCDATILLKRPASVEKKDES